MDSAISATDQFNRERQSSCFAILFLATFILAMMFQEMHSHGRIGNLEFVSLLGVTLIFCAFNWWATLRIYPVHRENTENSAARIESLVLMERKDRRLVAKLFRWTNVWLFALAICVHYCFSETQAWVAWAMVPYTAILAFKWMVVDMGRWSIHAKWTKTELERLIGSVVNESGFSLTTLEKYDLVDRTFEGREFQEPSIHVEIVTRIYDAYGVFNWPYCFVRGTRDWYLQKYVLKTEAELRSALMAQISKSRHA